MLVAVRQCPFGPGNPGTGNATHCFDHHATTGSIVDMHEPTLSGLQDVRSGGPWCSEEAGADKLPPPEPLDVEIGAQDALTPAGAVSAVIEGMIVVQVSPSYMHGCNRALLVKARRMGCHAGPRILPPADFSFSQERAHVPRLIFCVASVICLGGFQSL